MTTESWVAIGCSVVSTGLVGYVFKSAIRLEVLERLFAEKKLTIDSVKTNQGAIDTRLALVEAAVAGLNEVLPELRKLGRFADKLDLIFSQHTHQINKLEDAVFGKDEK